MHRIGFSMDMQDMQLEHEDILLSPGRKTRKKANIHFFCVLNQVDPLVTSVLIIADNVALLFASVEETVTSPCRAPTDHGCERCCRSSEEVAHFCTRHRLSILNSP
eukprot:g8725.t1